MVEKNAIIEKVYVGFEVHGIFTCIISLKTGNSMFTSFGNFFGQDGAPVGVFLKKLMGLVGVESLDECAGQAVRVRLDSPLGRINAIGHLMDDKWLSEDDFVYNRGDWKDGKS